MTITWKEVQDLGGMYGVIFKYVHLGYNDWEISLIPSGIKLIKTE